MTTGDGYSAGAEAVPAARPAVPAQATAGAHEAAPHAAAASLGPTAGTIADLTYRGYEGPIQTRAIRWWIVAVAGLRLRGWARTGYIVCISLSLLIYVFIGLILWLVSRFPQMATGGLAQFVADATVGQHYASAMFNGLNRSMFLLMVVMLIAGSSSIAADNQSNALLVYLAKPITKADYLFGKWASTFMLVFFAAFLPAFLLYVFCFLSFYSDGFLRQEPWLIFRIVAACGIVSAVFASLIVGISAWSKSGTIAAAIGAGIYIVTGIVSGILAIIMSQNAQGNRLDLQATMGYINTYHASLNGVVMGLAQWVLGYKIHMSAGWGDFFRTVAVRPPSPSIMGCAVVVIVIGGMVAARTRIRAVEVVTG